MRNILFVAPLLFPIACAAQSEVVLREDVQAYLSGNLPDYLEPYAFEYRVFEQDGSGSGRVSIEGDVRFTQNIVKRFEHFPRILPDLVQEMVPGNTADAASLAEAAKWLGLPWHAAARSNLSVYFKVIQIGWTAPFTAELAYLETVSGVRLSGEAMLQHSEDMRTMQTEADLGPNQMLVDSERFATLINQVAANAAGNNDKIETQKRLLIDWMSRDEIPFAHRQQSIFVVRGGPEALRGLEQAFWNENNNFAVLELNGMAEFSADRRLGYNATAKAGDRLPVRIELGVGMEAPRDGEMTIAIFILHGDRWHELSELSYSDGFFSSYNDWSVGPPE